jgi:hypothetical protein
MRKRHMIVSNIVEKVKLVSIEHQTGGNAVYWSITPSFVEETTRLVEVLKVVHVGFGAEPVEITDFKVGPLVQLAGVWSI